MLNQEMEYKQYPNPPYIQRSTSAPAIAENVSEAILPSFNYKDEQDSNNPSRLNPRIPNSKIYDESQAPSSSKLTIINNPGLLSLLTDSLTRTPMDLIQADFPSTPSSVYSNRIFDVTADLPDAAGTNVLPSSVADANTQLAIDQATKSLEQLYVNPDPSKGAKTSQNPTPLLSQYHSTVLHSSGNSGRNTSAFFPAGSTATAVTGTTNSSSVSKPPTELLGSSVLNLNKTYVPKNNTQTTNNNFNALLGNNPSAILNNGLNPLAPSVAMNGMLSMNSINAVPNMQQGNNALQQQQQQQQHSQPAYYVQQAVYLDQNGQPIYYRPGNQYGQGDFIYPSSVDGVSHLNGTLSASDMQQQMQQGSFMQYPGGGVAPINQQGLPTGYWTPNPADQSQMQNNGMAMYMNNQQSINGVVSNINGNDVNRRMVFNPATGQYNTVPVNNMISAQNPQSLQGGTRGTNSQAQIPQLNNASNLGYIPNNNMNVPVSLQQSQANLSVNIPALLPRTQQQGNNNGSVGLESDNMFNMSNNRDDDQGRNGNNNYIDYSNGNNNRDNRGDRGRDNYRGGHDRGNDRSGGNNRDSRDRDRNNRNSPSIANNNSSSNNNANNVAGVNPVRDSLVEEFRSTYGKSRQWGLRDLLGHVVAFCQDQHGSRFIQQRLEVCSDVDKQLIFDEIIPAAQSLMTDVFGNYVLQKLFEYGTPDQCESLALLLKGQSVQLAMQMYGCRVVQKALEYVNTPRLIELVAEFESPPLLLRCVHDSNGNHVIQKCIEIVSKVAKEAATPESSEYLSFRIQFIINAFHGRVKELSSHPYGCRVVQRILEHCSNNQKAVILEELRQCCTELVQDCYGNYVIQFVMQHGWEADRAVLIREVQANLLDFSQHKFASNVVEKCLQFANKKDRDEMIWTIINVTFDLKSPVDAKGHCVLESMVRDPYANYVVQKVIDVSDERQRGAIMRYVKENITQLRRYTYGKHIIVRLEKITNEKF